MNCVYYVFDFEHSAFDLEYKSDPIVFTVSPHSFLQDGRF